MAVFYDFLRSMSKKGFYEILGYIAKNNGIHYNDALRYCMEKQIIQSRASVTIILNGLTELGLVTREISQTRPIRTTYTINKKGTKTLKHLREMESMF